MLTVTYLEKYKTSIYKTCCLIVHWSTTLLLLQLACFVTCMHLPITHTTNTSHHIQPLHPVITPSNYKYNHTHHHTHHHTHPSLPPITPTHHSQAITLSHYIHPLHTAITSTTTPTSTPTHLSKPWLIHVWDRDENAIHWKNSLIVEKFIFFPLHRIYKLEKNT